MRALLTILLLSLAVTVSPLAEAGDRGYGNIVVAQSGGKSLNQAVEQVRRKCNNCRIVDAETRVQGGREVHYVKYLTKGGKVKTEKVNGKRVGN